MNIDLHVHTRERSACGRSTATAMVEAAIAAGLDALVLTDHDLLAPPAQLADLNDRYAPFRVFGGIEVSLMEGEHVLVLGTQAPSLESRAWDYPSLHSFVREQKALLVLNHPFRYAPALRIDVARYPPDAIELYSHNTPHHAEARIRTLAQELGLRVLANSDAHSVERLGAYYSRLDADPADERELVEVLRLGQYCCYAPKRKPAPGWLSLKKTCVSRYALSPAD